MVATVFLKKNLSIPPTLKIREGYGFNVVVVKDLVFAKPKRSTELLTSKERHKMRSIEIIPRDGSHYILVDGKEWSRHNDLKIAEQVRAELMRDERGINLEGNKEEQNLALRAAEYGLRDHVQLLDARLRDTSEESYATRNELRDEIVQFKQFIHGLETAIPGKGLDFTRQIVDYGYDPEQAASDRMCGLEYVSDFERAKTVYESSIEQIQPVIESLERAGIRVETGVISMAPPERDETMYDVEMEMER